MARNITQVRTKHCSDGTACGSPVNQEARFFIEDEHTICDACLLVRFGLTNSTYDGCGDPYSMNPLYDQDDVVRALRQASGL